MIDTSNIQLFHISFHLYRHFDSHETRYRESQLVKHDTDDPYVMKLDIDDEVVTAIRTTPEVDTKDLDREGYDNMIRR